MLLFPVTWSLWLCVCEFLHLRVARVKINGSEKASDLILIIVSQIAEKVQEQKYVWSTFVTFQRKQKDDAKHITCKQSSFVMKDTSVHTHTHTAAHCHQAPHPTNPPPLLTTVQQLDHCGALLAKMPTHSTPWCQNTVHSYISRQAQSKANRQTVVKTAQSRRTSHQSEPPQM